MSTGIQKCQPSLLPISLLFYRSCRWQAWCRRCSMIQSGPCVFDEICQHTKQLRQGKKIRIFFFNLTNLSARSASTRTCQSTFPKFSRLCPCFHLLLLCRLETTPRTRPCDCDEMSQHTKQLRQGKKIRFFFLISPICVTAQGRLTVARVCVPELDGAVIASTC